jgi:transposase-like protein
MFEPDDYFFQEEFIFPEQGGVTGMRLVRCPGCGQEFELAVDVGNTRDRFVCEECGSDFFVNWPSGKVWCE